MAQVYLAEHIRLGRRVALKLLLPELSQRSEIAGRFFAEARAVNAIRSEHITEITDFIEDGAEKYFIMELLEGPSLREVMANGRLPLERTLDIALQLARTLEVVHAAGILHRDLKPDNVMLTERAGRRDWVKLLDFGIAKFMDAEAFEASGLPLDTHDGVVLGTPAYLAPELLRGSEPDFRADVYSFGLVLFQMVTGQRPFLSKSLPELVYKQMSETAPRLAELEDPPYAIPDDLDSLVRRCLEKQRELRPPTMAHVVAELEMLCEQLGVPLDGGWTSSKDRSAERPVDNLRATETRALLSDGRRPQGIIAAAALAALLLLGTALLVMGSGDDALVLSAAPPVRSQAKPRPEVEPAPQPDPRLSRIDAGDTKAVLAELDARGPEAWSPGDNLVRGHALFSEGRLPDAWRAYDAAVGAGTVDERLLERALAALQVREADAAMDVLASWPDERASSALHRLLDDDGWWPRHHALKVLDDRGEGADVDRARLALKDLDTGPNCGARRYGLRKLAEHGASAEAVAGVDQAAERKGNGCLREDLEITRAAIESRMSEAAARAPAGRSFEDGPPDAVR